MFELRESKAQDLVWITLVIWMLTLIPIFICGFMGENDSSTYYEFHPEVICVTLPAWTGFLIAIGSLGWRHLVYTGSFFEKSGWTWTHLPYLFWGVKEVCLLLYICLVMLLFPITNFLDGLARLVTTLLVVLTIPDGQAETRIKKIWKIGTIERTSNG